MSDLISRSALMEELKSLQVTVTGLRAGKGILNEYAKQYRESLLRIIDEQPTAYDTDKVVAELEEVGQKMSEAKGNPWDSSDHKYYKAISVKKAISIVKAGGVE